jgi:hypothetical protein
MPKTFTARDAETACTTPVSIERLILNGVKLNNHPLLPFLKVTRLHQEGVQIALVLNASKAWFEFDGLIPMGYVPSFITPRHEYTAVNAAVVGGKKNIDSAFVLAAVKGVSYLTITRDDPEDSDAVNMCLTCGEADIALASTIDQFREFLSPDRPATATKSSLGEVITINQREQQHASKRG